MRILSKLVDKKIDAINVQLEMTASEYIDVAKDIVESNIFQRKRVKNSGSIYSLLKSDIADGCLIPSIVLASRSSPVPPIEDIDNEYFVGDVFGAASNLMILDGLQRTYSLLEVFSDQKHEALKNSYIVRVDVYLNISEVGILYRMLTLNAGQTPMSLRHQIEILYSNYAGKNIGDINIIRQVDDDVKKSHRDYIYSDLIEGYNSFLERNESPIDRYSLLDIVQSLGKIHDDRKGENSFTAFASLHYKFVSRLQSISNNWEYPEDIDDVEPEYKIQGQPFGSTPYKIFNRAQSLTGFGAAIGGLIDHESINDFSDLERLIDDISLDPYLAAKSLMHFNKCLDEIKQEAKKIGNAQRLFFRYFFRTFFDGSERDSYLKIIASADYAKKKTIANM